MINRGVTRCLIAAVLFGVSAPAASRLVDDLGAFTLAGLLYIGAALAVLPMIGRTLPTGLALRRSGRGLAIAVVFGGAVGPVLLAAGLAYTSAASASLLLNLELVATTVLAYFFFHEHIGSRVAAGTVLVVLAGVLLGWSGNADLRLGAVLIAGACLCWGLDNCITAALDDLSPAHITLAKGVVAGTANLTIGLLRGDVPGGWPVLAALVVGAFGYGISITLWVAGARELGAARGQLVFATAPFVGAIVSWTVLSEAVTGRELAALALGVVGVGLVLRSEHEHIHRHEAVEHDHEHQHGDEHHDHEHSGEGGLGTRHQHHHVHDRRAHAHPHMPDLHHRHDH